MSNEEPKSEWIVKVKDRQFCMDIPDFVTLDDDAAEISLDDLISIIALQASGEDLTKGLLNMKHCCAKHIIKHCCVEDMIKHCCVKDIMEHCCARL